MKNYNYRINIFKDLIMIIILFIPFQQSLTLQVGATIRISDIIICLLFFFMILKKIKTREKVIYINMFYLYMLLNTVTVSFLLNDLIKYGISTLSFDESSRILTNIATALIAIMSYSVGAYIGRNNNIFNKVINLWTKIIIFLSIYVIVQFVALNTIGYWMHLPGEHLNENTSYAFGLRRAYGFSIEPGALGNMLFFSFILIFNLLEDGKLKKVSLLFCVIAIFCSVSSIALISIIIFMILLIYKKNLKLKYKILTTIAFVILIFVIFNNSFLYTAIIDKIAGNNFSKMDRLANSTILKRMFYEYPVLGVGFGNYGALRNLFSYDTLIEYKNFYDMPNSFYFDIFGELGIVGVILFIKFIMNKVDELKAINKNVVLFIIPFLVLISPSSSIALDYMAIGLGIIYGRYLKCKVT